MNALTEIQQVLFSIMEIREASYESQPEEFGQYTKTMSMCLAEAMILHDTPAEFQSLLESMTYSFDQFYTFYQWAESQLQPV